jgi:hypothetical protein
VRRNLFAKLAFTFLALLLSVLIAVDFFAERAMRRDYERTGFAELASLGRIARLHPPSAAALSTLDSANPSLLEWMAQMSITGARVTIINTSGKVLTDSQVDSRTLGNQAVATPQHDNAARSAVLRDTARHTVRRTTDFALRTAAANQ